MLLSAQIHLDFPEALWVYLVLFVSHFRCPSQSPSLPPAISSSLCPPRPSVCLAYFLWRIVLVSSSLNKTRLFSPWGKTVLSSPQTCRPSPCLLPPPPTPHPNCLASAPSGKLPYSPHFSTVSSFPPFSSSHPEYQHLDRASFMLVTFLPTPLVSSLHLTVICQ